MAGAPEPEPRAAAGVRLGELLAPERVACNLHAASKKRALELVSELLASSAPSLSQTAVFESLIGRERLGSTGLGHGVAIPHARMRGAPHAVAAFVKLDQAVDYDATDELPVDLLFALLVPEHYTNEHLALLALLARMFSDPELRRRLREAASSQRAYELLTRWPEEHPAGT